MNRTAVAALLAAGVVGIVGGTVSAVVRGSDPGGTRADGPTSTPTPKPTGNATSGTVLYAGDRTIHDGDKTIQYYADVGTPDRLVRSATGYVIGETTSPDRDRSRIHTITAEGRNTPIADVRGRWDLNADGTRIVGTEAVSGRVVVWDLTGEVVVRAPLFHPSSIAMWQGTRVLISEPRGADQPYALHTWDPDTGTVKRTRSLGMLDMQASPDGDRLIGSVSPEGFSATETPNPCLRVGAAPGFIQDEVQNDWQTCDWRLPGDEAGLFSPDGSQVLAIPADSDGFGPGQFAALSAAAGPSTGVKSFLTPEATLGATWLDEDHLLLMGKTDLDLDEDTGTWIQRCDLEGNCTEVAKQKRGDLVLGEQG